MRGHRPLLISVALVLFGSLACATITGGIQDVTPTETSLPPVENSPTPLQEQATEEETSTPTSSPYFTEEFASDPQWQLAIIPDYHPNTTQKSDPESVEINFSNSHMVFHVPEGWLSSFYTYTSETYKDVRLDIEFDNRGVSSNQISLFCRSDNGDKSYEVEVGNDGKWVFKVNRRPMNNGASTAIHIGKGINHYSLICLGNEVTFLFNGEEPKGSPYIDNQSELGAGFVGFIVTSKRAVPVDVEIDWFKVSEP